MKSTRPHVGIAANLLLALVVLSGAVCANAKSHHSNNKAGTFDYYLLTLSWAPEFCATHKGKSSSECGSSHHFGFVVHGLWPENEDGSYPQHCAAPSPVAQGIVGQMLPIMPDRGLIQHEWATHGTCSGLDTQTYFGDIKKAFTSLQVPQEYRAPSQGVTASPSQIEQKFADANHAPSNSFRVQCSGSEFVSLEVCLTKDLQYRQCGSGVRECRASQVSLLPVR